MGWQWRKSIRVVPGVRLNFGKRGVGYSFGGRGYRLTRSADRRWTRTISIPGTGLRHVETLNPRPRQGRAPAPQPWEATLAAVIQGRAPGAALARLADDHPQAGALIRTFDALLVAIPAGQLQRARDLLQGAFDSGLEPADHPFVRGRVAGATLRLDLGDGVVPALRLQRTTIGLALGRLHYDLGDHRSSVAVLRQLPLDTPVAIQLARSLLALQHPTEALAVTRSVNGTGDAGMLLRVLEASALRIAGRVPEATRLLQGARGTRHGAAVLTAVEVELAACHLDAGDIDGARKQLAKAFATDPTHPAATHLLARLPTATPRH